MNDFIQRQADLVTQHLPVAHQLRREVSLCQFMGIYDLFNIHQDSQYQGLWAVILHWLKCILQSFTVNNASILISHNFCEDASVCFSYTECLLLLIQLDPAEGCYWWLEARLSPPAVFWNFNFSYLTVKVLLGNRRWWSDSIWNTLERDFFLSKELSVCWDRSPGSSRKFWILLYSSLHTCI